MKEKRNHPRFTADITIELTLDERHYHCTIINRSASGLLVRVHGDDNPAITPDDIGREITFQCPDLPDFSDRLFRARIIRIAEGAGGGLFAVVFVLDD